MRNPLLGLHEAPLRSFVLVPDGNLWFTEYTGNKIGKFTP